MGRDNDEDEAKGDSSVARRAFVSSLKIAHLHTLEGNSGEYERIFVKSAVQSGSDTSVDS